MHHLTDCCYETEESGRERTGTGRDGTEQTLVTYFGGKHRAPGGLEKLLLLDYFVEIVAVSRDM